MAHTKYPKPECQAADYCHRDPQQTRITSIGRFRFKTRLCDYHAGYLDANAGH